ncbi:solute carrier family 30 (zinc transporter), member 1 [Mytilus galloprovincialis]|uniref:Solute carrier family 30 (Zinc transporter), member 1 n=1 Tax=Mytilus galloprovincialis TaxID=29158 RepID=A0A8B6GPX2_MYTGA|nr:solute carrier family 30 (zinc transporter), member 1 [Mytilus galloprovincialis]VDI67403.1 solute carrier family 30 (zinc transporter), member 1 [Mytilus galloprovincialis]
MGKYSGKTCRLLTMLGMTASFFLVEIIVGYVTNSIALVADSFHMLSDVVALIVGFASVRISKWQTHKNTFGWIRAEILGAFVNAVFLIALCFSILVESLKRLVEIEEIKDPKLLLIVGSLGLAVNLIGLCLFHEHGHSHGGGSHSHSHEKVALVDKAENGHVKNSSANSHGHGHSHTSVLENSTEIDGVVIEMEDDPQTVSGAQLNMRGVFLHVLGDALGSVIVIISALLIWFVEDDWKYYMDPAMSILMVIIILSTTAPLCKYDMSIFQYINGHHHTEYHSSIIERFRFNTVTDCTKTYKST